MTKERPGYIIHTEFIETFRHDPQKEWRGGDAYFRAVDVWVPEDLPMNELEDYLDKKWEDPDLFVENWSTVEIKRYELRPGDVDDSCGFCKREGYSKLSENNDAGISSRITMFQIDAESYRNSICEKCAKDLFDALGQEFEKDNVTDPFGGWESGIGEKV